MMSADGHNDLQRLFLLALEVPRGERADWLAEQCGEDAALRTGVLELLEHAESENDPLEAGIDPALAAIVDEERAVSPTKNWSHGDDPTDREDEEIPQQIGRYEVRSRLGQGGFGDVFAAFDPSLQRVVAIKVPRSELIRSQAARDLYLTEARAVAQLDHPHIVPIHDAGQCDEQCFLVSKLIEGMSLRQALADGKLDRSQAVRIALQIAQALSHAHARGIFHRDIKPDNILLDQSGESFVTDFGIALSEDRIGSGPRVTGTLAYMSPEQVRGDSHLVDGRTDIYSLGVVLYEMLSGKRPFTAPNYGDLKRQICEISPRPLRSIEASIPASLEQLCNRAMSKPPEERFQTADELAAALAAELDETTPAAERVVSPTRGNGVLLTVMATVALLFVVGVAYVIWGGSGPPITNATSASANSLEVERFQIEVWGPGREGETIEDAMPIRSGDALTFDIRLSRAAYPYLFWIDTEGEPIQLYPRDPEAPEPVRRLRSPAEYQRGWPVVGEAGMETAVLLVRDTPFKSIAELESRLRLPAGAKFNTNRETVVYKLDERQGMSMVASGRQRGLGAKTVEIDRPVLALIDSLKDDFTAIEAIRVAHEELLSGTPDSE